MVRRWDDYLFGPVFWAMLALPLCLLILLALGEEWVWPEILPQRWSLANLERSFSGDRELLSGLLNSLILGALVSAIATVTGFLTARSVAYSRHPGRWLLAAYSPYVISPILYAIWIHIFFVKTDLSGTLMGVFTGQFLLAYPYAVIFFQGFWSARIRHFEELATTLGCSFIQTQYRIIWPMAKGMLAVCLFQCFLISWFEFGLTSLIGIGQIRTLPILVYTFVQEANIHLAAIASLTLVAPVIVISFFKKSWINKN